MDERKDTRATGTQRAGAGQIGMSMFKVWKSALAVTVSGIVFPAAAQILPSPQQRTPQAAEAAPLWKELSAWGPTVAAFAALITTLVTFKWNVRTQRQVARHTAQLARLSKQLNDLYGPLLAYYEAGERNWLQFLCEYSNDKSQLQSRKFFPDGYDSFMPPSADALHEYRRRMEQLFMPTNLAMERIIIDHADLVVGSDMPEELLGFLGHVSAARLLIHKWDGMRKHNSHHVPLVDENIIKYPHPMELKNYIRASFYVLKATQEEMLTNPQHILMESKLAKRIQKRKAEFAISWNERGPAYLKDVQPTTERWKAIDLPPEQN